MLKRFLSDTAGNVAMMLAFAAVPLCLGAGAAIDISRANYANTVLQGAVDAAALAGGTSKDKSTAVLKSTVEQYLAANHATDIFGYVTKIEQKLDMANGTFTVKVSGSVQTSFMALAGFKDIDIGASAVVNVGSQALELALVLDNTGSMAGAKIENLKSAATNLVNILEKETSSYAEARIALVPFAEYVNIGPSRLGESWVDASTLTGPFQGCVGSRNAPLDLNDGAVGQDYPALSGQPCNTEVLPLTDNMSAVKARIAAMGANGYTYIPTGLLWGWNLLTSAAPFTEGHSDAELKKLNGRKALILMTDGENTISPSYPAHDNFDVASANSNLEELCKRVKLDKIEVYTVSFMVPTEPIKDLLVACASKPSNYFDADNSAELYAAFGDIARQLAAVRLTQ